MRRRLGLLAPLGALGFVVGAVVASVKADAAVGGYLSELGAHGSAGADAFRLGLLAAATGCVGLAAALPHGAPGRRAGLLVAAASALSQALIRCSEGCPLPLVEPGVGLGDAAHFLVVAAGFAAWTGVATADAAAGSAAVAARTSRLAAGVLAAHLTTLAALLLVDPRSAASGVLQRTLVATALVWLAVAGVAAATRRSATGRRSAGAPVRRRLTGIRRPASRTAVRTSRERS